MGSQTPIDLLALGLREGRLFYLKRNAIPDVLDEGNALGHTKFVEPEGVKG
jgi:hypothetical protein